MIGEEATSRTALFFVPCARMDCYEIDNRRTEMHIYPVHFYLFYPEVNSSTWVFMFYGILLREAYADFKLLDQSLLRRGRHCLEFPFRKGVNGWVYVDGVKPCLVVGVYKGLLPAFVEIVEKAAKETDKILGYEGNRSSYIMLPEWRNGDILLAELQRVKKAHAIHSEEIMQRPESFPSRRCCNREKVSKVKMGF